jgi:hypothetical protein
MEAKPISLPTYNEIIEDTPIAVTATTTKARLIGETRAYKWVLSYVVRVRSMGTATYIALGTDAGREQRLTVAGQSIAYGCNRYEVIDMAKKYIISDTSDAVVEVSCTFLPIRLYGKVNMADRV